jgi:hypothetical protein
VGDVAGDVAGEVAGVELDAGGLLWLPLVGPGDELGGVLVGPMPFGVVDARVGVFPWPLLGGTELWGADVRGT